MAYEIRYGFDRSRQYSLKRMMHGQLIGSGMLVLVSGMIALLDGGMQLLCRLFITPPTSLTEQAVTAFADVLCRGEGWYRGLAVCCRTIIEGGAG